MLAIQRGVCSFGDQNADWSFQGSMLGWLENGLIISRCDMNVRFIKNHRYRCIETWPMHVKPDWYEVTRWSWHMKSPRSPVHAEAGFSTQRSTDQDHDHDLMHLQHCWMANNNAFESQPCFILLIISIIPFVLYSSIHLPSDITSRHIATTLRATTLTISNNVDAIINTRRIHSLFWSSSVAGTWCMGNSCRVPPSIVVQRIRSVHFCHDDLLLPVSGSLHLWIRCWRNCRTQHQRDASKRIGHVKGWGKGGCECTLKGKMIAIIVRERQELDRLTRFCEWIDWWKEAIDLEFLIWTIGYLWAVFLGKHPSSQVVRRRMYNTMTLIHQSGLFLLSLSSWSSQAWREAHALTRWAVKWMQTRSKTSSTTCCPIHILVSQFPILLMLCRIDTSGKPVHQVMIGYDLGPASAGTVMDLEES